MAEMDNKNGGIQIGGDKYNIQILDYDNNNNQNTEVAATNRLVYQDGVKYIISQATFESAWLPVTEKNNVIIMNANMNFNISNLTMYKYSFNTSAQNVALAATTGWFAKTYAQEAKKGVVLVFPDNQLGHIFDMVFAGTWKAFGITPTVIYYPASQQDLSAIGTKVVSLNPGLFMGRAGSVVDDAQIINAVVQAGYKGIVFSTGPEALLPLKAALLPQALEGFVSSATALDFDPPLTKESVDFKAAWIAKYGKWEGPDVVFAQNYEGLKAALIQAGSIDTDKVASVLSNGMKFDTLNGPSQMVSRPDLGNNQTTDSVGTYYIKTIHNGVAELTATIQPDEALGYLRTAFPPLPPGATPPGLPLAGP